MSTCWSKDDPKQGSAFHELVVLPTVAPHLAEPYHVPGTPDFQAAQAELARQSGPDLPAPSEPAPVVLPALESSQPNEGPPTPDPSSEDHWENHEFFVLVILEWTERVKAGRSVRPKKVMESKNTPDVVKILTLTRAQFVTAALSAHGLQNAYIPGPTSGPGMQISWTGIPGGKSGAPVVQDDADWNMTKIQLREQARRTRGKLNNVCVTFDLNAMEGFKNRKRPLSSAGFRDMDQVELLYGIHVPSVDNFSPNQVALGRAIEDIKAAWKCEKHGRLGAAAAANLCCANTNSPMDDTGSEDTWLPPSRFTPEPIFLDLLFSRITCSTHPGTQALESEFDEAGTTGV
ncbi:hypothetical protein CVT26_005439 [Gymnopilus dilepis]|uniref:Uncharacterized protein n=1 Tax=Gymnopilus dilepis TaxID=231916 RepID=A0A409WC14_9AGAR|nr:hypothetical protein CVT26_005439 [Gymnopilus dilepis]